MTLDLFRGVKLSLVITEDWLYHNTDCVLLQLNDVSLEGDITVPGAPKAEDDDEEFNTLDEPVKDTVVSTQNAMPCPVYEQCFDTWRAQYPFCASH